MLGRTCIFIVVLACFGILGAWAQLCIPDPVETITLENSTLSWSASNNCPDTQYIIVIRSSGIIVYEYTVDSLSLNVSFLQLCRRYSFTVTSTADHILGLDSTLDSGIALPEDTDIVVQNFTGVQLDDDVLIQWLVDDEYSNCIAYYNVRILNEDSETADSMYIGQNGYLLEHVAQCMNYQIDITAHYSSRNGTTAQFNYTVPEKTNTPTLVQIRQNSEQINTTWSLEKYSLNRCNVTALYVNGTHFNQTIEIVDSPDRPDVQVSITGLRADSMYYFNVSTENNAGISQAYKMAVQTLPIDPTDRKSVV